MKMHCKIMLSLLIIITVSGYLSADPISLHREEQAAIKAGLEILRKRGCTVPWWTRTKSIELFNTENSEVLIAVGNNLTFTCKSNDTQFVPDSDVQLEWSAPTERENGDDLPLNEINSFEIHFSHDTDTSATGDFIVILPANYTQYKAHNLKPGDWSISILTVDTDGVPSLQSNIITQAINF